MGAMSLQDWLSLISTIAIVMALVFAGVQVREANKARRDQAAVALLQSAQGDTWTRSMDTISRIPAGLDAAQVDAQGEAATAALVDFAVRVETIGYMVFSRMVSLELVDDLLGGVVLMFWNRAKDWTAPERARTGKGGIVDTSLYETSCAWMEIPLADYIASQVLPKRTGSGVGMIVPYQAFPCSDGHLMIASGNDNLFRKLCTVIGQPALADDPRFTKNAGRVENRDVIIALLSGALATQTRSHWQEKLEAVGVPCGPERSIPACIALPLRNGSLRTP